MRDFKSRPLKQNKKYIKECLKKVGQVEQQNIKEYFFLFFQCLVFTSQAHVELTFKSIGMCVAMRMSFIYLLFFKNPDRKVNLIKKEEKTTKSLDAQEELCHQGWIQSTPGAHYQIQLSWQGSGQQYCLIFLHERKCINEDHLLIQGNPG